MIVDTRPREDWSKRTLLEHAVICEALAELGELRERQRNPPPTADYRRRREIVLTDERIPHGYCIVFRTENADDIGVYRCLGPGGWEAENFSPVMAVRMCRVHAGAER